MDPLYNIESVKYTFTISLKDDGYLKNWESVMQKKYTTFNIDFFCHISNITLDLPELITRERTSAKLRNHLNNLNYYDKSLIKVNIVAIFVQAPRLRIHNMVTATQLLIRYLQLMCKKWTNKHARDTIWAISTTKSGVRYNIVIRSVGNRHEILLNWLIDDSVVPFDSTHSFNKEWNDEWIRTRSVYG